MSELKLVAPLLDGFAMGDPISDHDGVRCCPAMKENSDDKYIVKIISVPASQKRLDALLLTGAYKDAGAAAEYFKGLAEDTVKEARLLQQLAKLEGFLSYEGWQIVPMEGNEIGYDIYLLGSYKRSLEKFLRRNPMTHLNAVNLGIDLCAALSLCRRAGFIYTDLKPSNIFISGQKEFRIGDLGFSKLSAMKYTSLTGKFISRYTAPELHDPMSTLNPTADTYALGMILYQIYNNGHIPFETKAPMRTLPAPLNADYEMAEIILKACDPNPRKRYQTPIEMGQALVSYMQRNSVNDVPIVPPTVGTIPVQPAAPVTEDTLDTSAEAAAPAESSADFVPDQPEELRFMEDLVSDDTAPSADAGDDLVAAQMTDEVDLMLAQADELISHEPDLTADVEEPEESKEAEDPGDLEASEEPQEPTLETEKTVSSASEAPVEDEDPAFNLSFSDSVSNDDEDDDLEFGLPTDPSVPVLDDTDGIEEDISSAEAKPRKKRGWIGIVIAVLILALLGCAGYYYYENYYLLRVDGMVIDGFENVITVNVSTEDDESLLKAVCTDTYGNKHELPLTDGKAVFTDLNPDTMYKITLEAEGFHKLIGSSTGNYTTSEVTDIVDFTAKAGAEDGSVILNFTVDGPETQDWIVEYTAEGEEPKSVSFTGHMVTITDLTVGRLYTFSLTSPPSAELYLTGNTTLEYLASKIIVADDLSIISCVDGVLTVQWAIPEDAAVESWSVRCYSDDGYDEIVTVTDTTAQFSNISAEHAYTVEVTAAGMSQNTRAFVTANPVTVTDAQVSYEENTGLTIAWNSASAPEGGWLVMYSIDGSESTEMAVCTGTTAVVKNVIPNAAYNFQIKAADGSTVFGGNVDYAGIEPTAFYKHGLSAEKILASLCRTPDKDGWTYKDVKDSSYTTSYDVGEKASLVLYTNVLFYLNSTDTNVTFVIRDADGKVIQNLIRSKVVSWRELWPTTSYCHLDLPVMPTEAGAYTVELYFDGGLVLSKNFSIITTNG